MANPLSTKLSGLSDLGPAEHAEVDRWCEQVERLPANCHLVHEGDVVDTTCVMLSGWACRIKTTAGGKRQIVGLMLPGDMCDLHGFVIGKADHGITTLSDASVARIPSATLRGAIDRLPGLTTALWWSTILEEAISREWLLNIGQRLAAERIASFLCEVWFRAERVGMTSEHTLAVPMSQTELGQALGLTAIHLNRKLRELRLDGLVEFQNRRLVINDLNALIAFAGFDPTYLRSEATSF